MMTLPDTQLHLFMTLWIALLSALAVLPLLVYWIRHPPRGLMQKMNPTKIDYYKLVLCLLFPFMVLTAFMHPAFEWVLTQLPTSFASYKAPVSNITENTGRFKKTAPCIFTVYWTDPQSAPRLYSCTGPKEFADYQKGISFLWRPLLAHRVGPLDRPLFLPEYFLLHTSASPLLDLTTH